MSIVFDQKEDLRHRMAELEKKLAESEEERGRLEKTCNVLMRAFREEEKMQYKALNKKYEKFLEDCSVRKRRNDIILKSLCRIEDRSKALFARTERLKLLKVSQINLNLRKAALKEITALTVMDRYISYLNISDYKKGEIHSGSWRSFPLSSSLQRTTSEGAPRHVQWTTPLATHLKTERLKQSVRNLSEENVISDAASGHVVTRVADENHEKSEKEDSDVKQRDESWRKGDVNAFNGIYDTETVGTSNGLHSLNPIETGYGSLATSKQISEKLSQINAVNSMTGSDTAEITLREKQVTGYNDSFEKLKKSWLSEGEYLGRGKNNERGDPHDEQIEEKEGAEQSASVAKQNKLNDTKFPRINYNWGHGPGVTEKEESDNEESEIKSDSRPDYHKERNLFSPTKSEKSLPLGLDGVDYQNETYPESYYEQPVHHHNHTSIASDVILEEDETEQELEEEEKNVSHDGAKESNGDSPRQGQQIDISKQTKEPIKGYSQASDEVKSRESDSEKSSEAKKSDKSESGLTNKSDKNKTMVRSNLIHLLESDSESFQIEHGDAISGNEDSDFDFSFNQN